MALSNGHLDRQNGNLTQPVVEAQGVMEEVRISSFEQGVINGLLGVDVATYEAFITHSEQKKLESVRLKKIREQVANNEVERQQVKENLLNLHQTIQEREGQIQNSEARISKRERDRRRMEEEQGHWADLKRQQIIDYSVASSIIFVLVGILFLLVDVFISKDVALNALRFKVFDAWIFAIGLACIAFVLKFAVDRIFEKPFRESGKFWRMALLLIFASLAALTTLGFSGYIRTEGAILDVQKQKFKTLQEDSLSGSLAESNGQEVGVAKKEESALKEGLLSRSAVYSFFIMSAILFGISGAICFSIAMPNLTGYMRRGRANRKIRKLDKKLDLNYANILKERTLITQFLAEKETANIELDLLKPLTELQVEYKQLLEEELMAIEAMFKEQQAAEKAWYQEGHERGKKVNLRGDLFVTPYQIYQHIFQWKTGKKATGGVNYTHGKAPFSRNGVETNRDEGYLHQEIRKIINYNFNKNQGY